MSLGQFLERVVRGDERTVCVRIEQRDEHGCVIGFKRIELDRVRDINDSVEFVIQQADIDATEWEPFQ